MTTERTPDSKVGAGLRRNIDILLSERGLRPKDLYLAINMPASTYSSMFKSQGGPNLATLTKIAAALGCSIKDLLG
jgi:DNA-binding Xre family transcriptional regulator